MAMDALKSLALVFALLVAIGTTGCGGHGTSVSGTATDTGRASADSRIVVQHGIAGLELQIGKAQVRTKLGKPAAIRNGTNDFGPFTQFVYPDVTVSFQSGSRATSFLTSSRVERTEQDVGVDSTEAEVKAGVAKVHCRTESGFRHCFVGRFLAGRVVTDFHMRQGRVSSVVIGYVID